MAGVRLLKKQLSSEQLAAVRAELTVRADWDPKTSFGPKPPTFAVYTEDTHALNIPRYYQHQQLPQEHQNRRSLPTRLDLQFTGQLRKDLQQDKAVQAAITAFNTVGGGILSLPTGYGKTCVALYLLCHLKQRTMILVHKEFLADQWLARIQQFIPTAKVGRLQGSIIDVEGKDIVIGMLQSVCLKDYPPECLGGFGLLLGDECHHLSAPTFCHALTRIPTMYTLGLSATRIRKDGLTKVFEWFLGPCFFEIHRSAQRHVHVETLRYDKDFGPPLLTRWGKLCISNMVTELCEDMARTRMILDRIKSLCIVGRKIIVLTDRRTHCHEMVDMLKVEGIDAGLYMGGMKQSELKESEKCQVIVGTFSLAEEGLDICQLDTIVLGSSRGDVVQSVGRILRESGQEKEHDPLVVDVRDNWSCFISQYNKRCRWYRSVGFRMLPSSGKSEAEPGNTIDLLPLLV